MEAAINPEHNPSSYGGITIPALQDTEDLLRQLEAEDCIPDAGEIDRPGSESDEDYEVSARKRKSKKVGIHTHTKKNTVKDSYSKLYIKYIKVIMYQRNIKKSYKCRRWKTNSKIRIFNILRLRA